MPHAENDRSPTNICILAAESTIPATVDRDKTYRETWTRGGYCWWRRQGFRDTRATEYYTTDRRELWRQIWSRAHPSRPLHIFAYDAARVLTLSGFWRELIARRVGFEIDELDWLPGKRPDPEKTRWRGILCDADPPVIVSVWHQSGGRVKIVDTHNYWRDAKPDGDDAESHVFWCKERITELIKWHQREHIGSWAPTAPAMAMSAWRTKCPHWQTVTPHDDDHVRKTERLAYYGGRVEVYRVGRMPEPAVQVDVNSLYPSVMEDLRVPVELLGSTHKTPRLIMENPAFAYECLATVELDTESPDYPVRLDGRTCYPVGRFVTTLPGPELARAVFLGVVRRVLRCYRYRCESIFSEYVQWARKARELARASGSELRESFAKLLANSLYGKFGQKLHRWESVSRHINSSKYRTREQPVISASQSWLTMPIQGQTINVRHVGDFRPTKFRQVGHHWQMQLPPSEHPKAFPPISAWVTAEARLQMAELVRLCGKPNVWHISTDALLISASAYIKLWDSGLIDPDEPGLLKVVMGEAECEIHAPNWFRIGGRWTRSGLPDDATYDGDGKWTISTRESMGAIIERGVTGSIKRTNAKRLFVLSDGNRHAGDDGIVHPIRLGD